MTRLRLVLILSLLAAGCGKTPTEPDTRAPVVDWLEPDPAIVGDQKVVFEDTITVEFTATDDGGTVTSVTVYLGGAAVVTLNSAPYRTNLDLTGIDRNRSAPAYATAVDPEGNVGSTPDTLLLVYAPPPDTAQWQQLMPARLPSARERHSLAADVQNRRAVLFGGFSAVTFSDLRDLWVLDLVADTWDSVPVVNDTLITPRSGHGAAVIGDTLFVLGGETGISATLVPDYIALHIPTGLWRLSLLPERVSDWPAVAHQGSVYAYGGRVAGPPDLSNRLWQYDVAQGAWSWDEFDAATSPRGRVSAALVVDVEGGRLFVFGGISTDLQDPPSDSNWYLAAFPPGVSWETRSYVPGATRAVPPPLQGTCAVYDSLENRLLVWGGEDNTGGYPDDLWEFSLGARLWRRVPTTGATPSGRAVHQMVMDAPSRRVIMFGGRLSGLGTNEMWELDLDPGP